MVIPVQNIITNEATRLGIAPEYAIRIAEMESNLNPNAKNPKSSAFGVYQTLNSTYENFGGRPEYKNNPEEQVKTGLAYLSNVKNTLETRLKRPITGSELYMGHLLGPEGAYRALTADSKIPFIEVVKQYSPKNAEAIVNNNGMANMTTGQVIQHWGNKFNKIPNKPDTTNLQIASNNTAPETQTIANSATLQQPVSANNNNNNNNTNPNPASSSNIPEGLAALSTQYVKNIEELKKIIDPEKYEQQLVTGLNKYKTDIEDLKQTIASLHENRVATLKDEYENATSPSFNVKIPNLGDGLASTATFSLQNPRSKHSSRLKFS